MKKRVLGIALAACVLGHGFLNIGRMPTAIAANSPLFVFADIAADDVQAICADGNGAAYLLCEDTVLLLKEGAEAPIDVALPPEGLCAVAWYDDHLLGVSRDGVNVYRLVQDAWLPLCSMQAVLPPFSEEDGPWVLRCVAQAGYLLLSYYNLEAQAEETLCVSLSTGAGVAVPNDGITLLCPWLSEDVLLMADGPQGYSLSIYSVTGEALSPYGIIGFPALWYRATYHAASGKLFCANAAGQIYVSVKDQPVKAIATISNLVDMAPFTDAQLLLWTLDAIYLYDTERMEEVPTLTTMGMGGQESAVFFAQTGIRIIDALENQMSAFDHLVQAVLSHDDSIDIYAFLTRDGLRLLKEKGFYSDLRQSDALRTLSSELYPLVRQAITGSDGALAAWPLQVLPVLRFDELDVKEYGLSAPITFEEMLDVAQALIEAGVMDGYHARMFSGQSYCRADMLEYFLKLYTEQAQMQGAPIRFDTPTFKRIVTRIMEELPESPPESVPDGEGEPTVFRLDTVSYTIHDMGTYPFRIDDQTPPAIETMCFVAVINPYSKHIPDALAYLEHIAGQKDVYAYAIYASMADPLENRQVAEEIAGLQEWLEEAQALLNANHSTETESLVEEISHRIEGLRQRQLHVTPEDIAKYQEMAKHLYISEYAAIRFDDEMQRSMRQLLAGMIDVPEFIRRCERRAAMFYAE